MAGVRLVVMVMRIIECERRELFRPLSIRPLVQRAEENNMKSSTKHLLILLAAAGLVAMTVYDARADDPGQEPVVVAQEDGSGGGATEFTAADKAFIDLAVHVRCYNKRIADVNAANAAIDYYLLEEGTTIKAYAVLEESYKENAAVQAAIQAEDSKCEQLVLVMPPDVEPIDPTIVVPVGTKVLLYKDLDVKDVDWDIKFTGSGGGASIVIACKDNEKCSADVQANSTTLGGSGSIKGGDSLSFTATSGKGGSVSVSCSFDIYKVIVDPNNKDAELTEEDEPFADGVYIQKKTKKGSCSISGKADGKSVSASISVKKK